MKKLFMVVEGETEERFCRRILAPHFGSFGIKVYAQQWITNERLGAAGGGNSFDPIERHIRRILKAADIRQEDDVWVTTMMDLYGFPRRGKSVYTHEVAQLSSGRQKIELLEMKMSERIGDERFIPYVQLHEFETLILCEPLALLSYFTEKEEAIYRLRREIKGIPPEDINETPDGAPSKRIMQKIPRFRKQKATAGLVVTREIGLGKMRRKCPHFDRWLQKLEGLENAKSI
ncbi:MAG: DUF4276 family protein [Balneolales bacterium]|nr:DUF4276 family protein [Balneolales bacterium]